MKKPEIVNAIAKELQVKKVDATGICEDMKLAVEAIAKNLEVGDKANLGYFTVEKVAVPAKTARNPKTGEVVDVPAKVVIKIKATSTGKALA